MIRHDALVVTLVVSLGAPILGESYTVDTSKSGELVAAREYCLRFRRKYAEPNPTRARNGTPSPTLSPMMSLLFVPSVLPLRMPPSPPVDDAVDEVDWGTYDVGVPDVAPSLYVLVPKGIAAVIEAEVLVGIVFVVPDSTATTAETAEV